MAYQALYRKWRPAGFDDVKGQDAIVETLRNQIEKNRVGHAYLFCGTRGTGKTSVAKIFAKAVNCEHPVNGSPCNECAMCRAVNEQRSMNVIEIDAASNNGVDNIREIREEVAYSPSEGKYKVYIIDEVHMLSPGAFNAMLKTLEEPPSYVIFILATTESHKIPITILSRCQRYDFKRISTDTIAARLRQLADAEQLDVEDMALRYIARMGDGSMRDALSLLDQCIAFYLGKRLRYDNVLEVLGAVDQAVFGRLFRYVVEQDTNALIRLIDDIMMQGRELTQFVTDFTWYLRNLLMVKSSDQLVEMIEVSEDQLKQLQKEAELADTNTILRYIRIFSDLANQVRYASQKRVMVEVALIKLCQPAMERSYDSVLNRLAILEKKMEEGYVVASRPAEQIVEAAVEEKSVNEPIEKAIPEDIQQLINQWKKIREALPNSMQVMIRGAQITEGPDNQIIIGFYDDMRAAYFEKEKNNQELESVLSEAVSKQVSVKIIRITEDAHASDDFIDPAHAFQGIDIVYEDE